MVLCDNCGYSNKETAKFCHSCGTKIEVEIEIVAPVVEKESTAKILEEERKKAETKLERKNPFFKRKKKSEPVPYPSVGRDWFWDGVEFSRQSHLAIGLGIFQIIGAFIMLLWFPSNDFFTKLLMFILWLCIGAVLISLGARKVPNYYSLKYAIQDYVDSKIKHS